MMQLNSKEKQYLSLQVFCIMSDDIYAFQILPIAHPKETNSPDNINTHIKTSKIQTNSSKRTCVHAHIRTHTFPIAERRPNGQ